jgi:hypothetical protein
VGSLSGSLGTFLTFCAERVRKADRQMYACYFRRDMDLVDVVSTLRYYAGEPTDPHCHLVRTELKMPSFACFSGWFVRASRPRLLLSLRRRPSDPLTITGLTRTMVNRSRSTTQND